MAIEGFSPSPPPPPPPPYYQLLERGSARLGRVKKMTLYFLKGIKDKDFNDLMDDKSFFTTELSDKTFFLKLRKMFFFVSLSLGMVKVTIPEPKLIK